MFGSTRCRKERTSSWGISGVHHDITRSVCLNRPLSHDPLSLTALVSGENNAPPSLRPGTSDQVLRLLAEGEALGACQRGPPHFWLTWPNEG